MEKVARMRVDASGNVHNADGPSAGRWLSWAVISLSEV